MTPAAQSFLDKCKADKRGTLADFHDATHLTAQERNELARSGSLTFTTTRERGQILGHYPARMREADLREVVNAKRLGRTP